MFFIINKFQGEFDDDVVGACWISYWVGTVKHYASLLVLPFEISHS